MMKLLLSLLISLAISQYALAEVWTMVGSFSSTTSVATTTLTPITGFPGTPKAIVLFWSGRTNTTDAVGSLTHRRGIGFVGDVATERGCAFSISQDGVTTTVTAGAARNDAAVGVHDTAGDVVGRLDVSSLDANGFTMVVDDQFPDSVTIGYIAWGGGTISASGVGFFQMDTVTGSHQFAGAGFDPTFVMFSAASPTDSAPPTSSVNSRMFIGAATGPSNEWVWAGGAADAVTTTATASYFYNGECIAFPSSALGASILTRAEFTNFITGGWEVNILETSGTAQQILYLAIAGGDFRVGTLTTQTDTTTDIVVSGLASKPTGALLVSAGKALSTQDTATSDDRLSIGGWNSTSGRRAQGMWDDSGVTTTAVATAVEFDQVYANINADAIVGLMDIISVQATGATYEMDDADPVGSAVGYVHAGPEAVTGSVPAYFYYLNSRRGR